MITSAETISLIESVTNESILLFSQQHKLQTILRARESWSRLRQQRSRQTLAANIQRQRECTLASRALKAPDTLRGQRRMQARTPN